ncbi:hypothetical protein D0T49_12125 [Paludibacter sp. 221]|uniref:hypothetical protein n=1 Tax=Paludibacter sp. 221 TaxID=2302939 RepID=UPI0013D63054|nr:hypothetical protein [Paludibacter sp. 221]NDV47793.1 hypothetical protein [Paludibacter sp. 221]
MPAKQQTPHTAVSAYLEAEVRKRNKQLIAALVRIGEQAIAIAAASETFRTGSGNLRSSIGYAVVNGGKVEKLEMVKGGQGSSGANEGRRLLTQLAAEHSQGVSLIVAAGAGYAVYMEASGRDVLTHSELTARKLVQQLATGRNV